MTAFAIRGDEIDYELARGSKDVGNGNEHDEAARSRRHAGPRVSSLSEVLANRRILIFAASAVLFQLANAAMWPLVGQRISVDKPQSSSLLMAAGIIVAQLVMIPVAALAGRLTEARGRKSIFLIGFISLPIRGVLFTLSDQRGGVRRVERAGGGRFDQGHGAFQFYSRRDSGRRAHKSCSPSHLDGYSIHSHQAWMERKSRPDAN